MSKADSKTVAASLGGVPWTYQDDRNTFPFGLVLDETLELRKIPSAETGPEGFSFVLRILSDSFEIFKDDAFAVQSCSFDKFFGNSMIDDRCMPLFLSGKPFQGFSSTFCAFGLDRGANPLPINAILLKRAPGHYFSGGSCCNIDDSEINSDEVFYIDDVIFRNFHGLEKVPFSFFQDEICFSLDVGKIGLVVTDKRNLQASVNGPDGYKILPVSKNPGVISDSTKWPEGSFLFPIELVGIDSLAYASNKYLSRKPSGLLQEMIDQMMNPELIPNFFLPHDLGDPVASGIGFLQSRKKKNLLCFVREKLDLESQFHGFNLNQTFESVKKKNERRKGNSSVS